MNNLLSQLTANDRVILVRTKLERAKKHLHDLTVLLSCFKDEYREVSAGFRDPATGFIRGPYSRHRLPVFPSDGITAAGDIVHNLRSALDHLAYQLVLVGSPGIEPSRRIEFPIAKDLATYKAEKARKVEGMRADAIAAIDSLKPYKDGNPHLWRIHELDNIDKHRTLFTVGIDYLLAADWIENGPYWVKASDPHFSGVFASEVEDKAIQLEIEKSCEEPQAAYCNALLPTIRDLVYFVDELVISFRLHLE